MANIFIDPVIVMLPSDDTGRDDVEVWLANLDIWLQEALSGYFTWLHAIEVTELLEANGRFPSFATLRPLLKKYGLDINPAQIARRINEFFRNPDYDLKGNLEKLDFLVDIKEESTQIQPTSFVARWPEFIHDNMHLLLATTCAYKHTIYDFAKELRIATVVLADTREVQISTAVTYAIPEFIRGADNRIAHSFPLLFTPDDLLPFIDIIKLWNEGEQGIHYAIEQEYKKIWGKIVIKPLTYEFGPKFIESINDVRLDTNRTVLTRIVRAAAATIAGKDQETTGLERHPLTRGKNGPQRIRPDDGAKAWRLDLMMSGAGWRLHYWRIPGTVGDSIEFSYVQKESGTKIM